MSNITDLPNNHENYYRKACNYLEKGQLDQALQLFEKSYESQVNLPAFIEIIYLAINFQHLDKLINYWQKFMPKFNSKLLLQSTELLNCWITSAQYLYSRNNYQAYLNDLLLESNDESNTQLIKQALKSINGMTQQLQTLSELNPRELQEYLSIIHQEHPFELLKVLKLVYQEFQPQFYHVFDIILQNPNVENYIKSDILHFMIQNPNKDTIEMQWFHQQKSISLKDLQPYHQSTLFQTTIKNIQAFHEKHNPHLYESVLEQFTLQAMVFYPFIDEILIDPTHWLLCFRKECLKEELSLNTAQEQLIEYIRLANMELQNILI